MITQQLTGGFLNETHRSGKENSRNILYVHSGMATQTQIEDGIQAAISHANNQLRTKLGIKFEINVVMDRDGKFTGHSHVHVSDTKLANVLRGFNPDGSTRIETTAPSFEEIMEETLLTSWADMADDLDSKTFETHKSLFTPIRIIYSDDQSATAVSKGWEGDGYTLIIGWLEIKTSDTLIKEGYNHNIITGKIPKDLTSVMLHNMFDQFNTSDNTFRRGHEAPQSYPVIEQQGDDVDIIYDYQTNDAQVAFQMRKKYSYGNTTLYFGHKQPHRCSRNGDNRYNTRPTNQNSYSRKSSHFQEPRRGRGRSRF